MAKKNALGRGLGALIEEAEQEVIVEKEVGGAEVSIDLIDTNPFQPRTFFDENALEELATSIKEVGVIQPITVRELENGRYQLITGERRFRAARKAGLTEIPAYIRTANDQGMLEMSVENTPRGPRAQECCHQLRLVEECALRKTSASALVKGPFNHLRCSNCQRSRSGSGM
jgi:ParB family chromosome partitioning protein